MDKKTLALLAGLTFFSPKVEANENPAKNLDTNSQITTLLEKPTGKDEKTLLLENFAGNFQQQVLDSVKKKEVPKGFVKELILDNQNISNNLNSLEKNSQISEQAENAMESLRTKVLFLEMQMAAKENNKLELAREYFAKMGKFDAGDPQGWKNYQEKHPKTVRKLIEKIEKSNKKLNKAIKDNDVENYANIQLELDKYRKILETMEAIDSVFQEKKTASEIELKDIKNDSELMKKYNKAVEKIFIANDYLSEIENYEFFLDIEKGIQKMQKIQEILDIYNKLSPKKEAISYENNQEIQTILNILGEIRELKAGEIMNIPTDNKTFLNILNELAEIAGLVGLDEDRRKIKNYLETLEKNDYPDDFDIFNLDDVLKSNDRKISLKDLISKLSVSLDNHKKFAGNTTATNISEKEKEDSENSINRFDQLNSLLSLYNSWDKLSAKQQAGQYENFSKTFASILENHYEISENPAKKNELLSDLESMEKVFWKGVYKARVSSNIENRHTGERPFAKYVIIHEDGKIEIIK